MNTEPFRTQLTDYILSGHSYLHVPTTERTRFLGELKSIAESLPDGGRQVYTWSQAAGWRDGEGNVPALPNAGPLGPPDSQKVAQEILDLPDNAVLVLHEFGFYVQHRTFAYADVVIAWLAEIRDPLAASGRTVIFLGPDFEVPAALANDVTTVEFPLPDDAAIEQSVRFVTEGHGLDRAALPAIVAACRGMTQQQVEDRTALALRKFKTLDRDAARLILNEKADLLRRGGLLTYREPPPGGLERVGGNQHVKQHIARDKACFTDPARAFGIDPPRGLMLTGVPGCGKTEISLCAAGELGIPLIQFDVGCMMSKWVGQSESNVRSALRQIAVMAPCVVQFDEIEKGFGSAGTEGDSGASLRAFGTLLKWMSERTCAAYLIMTANDVSRLPPEFTRKGRIDEIYGIYLPVAEERAEILRIHLGLKGRDPQAFDVEALADATDAYTGADLKEVVTLGLKLAFHAGGELSTAHLREAIPEIRPLSRTDPERVAAMTAWLDRHTKPASAYRQAAGLCKPSAPAPPPTGPKSKRRVAV